ncbi:MAG: ABC transporter permease/M1 family aminopeptidase [Verrucomicrobiota bacterium]
MLLELVRFELRHQVRSPLFLVSFALFFLLTFWATTLDEIQIGSGGNVLKNSPAAIVQTVAILNLFALFVITAFVANAVVRDDETGFAPLLRSTRVRKADYLIGRFIGSSLVSAVVCLAIPLGILLGSLMPWQDPEKIGPMVLQHYAYAILVFGIPTQLAIGGCFFALATATRSMMWTYVGLIGFLVAYTVSRILLRADDRNETLSVLMDPFGLAALAKSTRYWTVTDRNRLLPPLDGLLLQNRLLWMTVGAAAVAASIRIFRVEARGRRGPEAVAKSDTVSVLQPRSVPTPIATVSRAGRTPGWAQFLALTRFDLAFVFRSPAFFVLMALGVFNSIGGMSGVVDFRGTPSLPVTRAVVEALIGAFALFPLIIAVYYGGELVWRDRESRIHEIVDACPAPNWAFLLPKVLAIALALLGTFVVAVVAGVGFQIYHGYHRFEWMAYLLWFVLPTWISMTQVAVLSVTVQSLVPTKPMGWAVMLVYLVAEASLGTLGFQHKLYNFGETARVPLSDMNGMGHFWIGPAWQQAYWTSVCVVLLVLVHVLRIRGVDLRWHPRLRRAPGRLRGPAAGILGVAVALWMGLGAWIFFNTNLRNTYRPSTEAEALAAEAERVLLPFEKVPQPTIRHVELDVDLRPSEIRAVTIGRYQLENRNEVPVDVLHVDTPEELQIRKLEIEGGRLQEEMPRFGHRILRLDPPMKPGERRELRFETVLEQRGFVNSAPQTALVDNGTFLNNASIAPTLGVPRDGFLQGRSQRRKHGLPPELRPPALEDRSANARHYLRHDSDWVTAVLTVTTDADQIPVAPGRLDREDVRDGRRTRIFRNDVPIQNFFSIQSGRYAVRSETWTRPGGTPVELAVYHHPPHTNNVPRMLAAMKASLEVFNERFSPYQFDQFRILEFPAYASFAQSFANTVPYSEAIGFIQDFDDADGDRKIDQVTFVTAHEIAHQWWAHQVIGADKQGSTLLSETFSQYSALLVMEKLYGREQIRKFLKQELDTYLSSRGSESVEETPLARVEDQAYIHYNKGALAMWWLKEALGEETVNRSLRRLLKEFAFKAAPYPDALDFLRILREEAGPSHDDLITDLFERITLYDLNATAARVTKREDGRYDVVLTVEAKKLYADGQGEEKEAPLDEVFEIGAFRIRPGDKGFGRDSILSLERRPLKSGSQEIRWVADEAPAFVGVDPFHYRIDRNTRDNVKDVSVDRK